MDTSTIKSKKVLKRGQAAVFAARTSRKQLLYTSLIFLSSRASFGTFLPFAAISFAAEYNGRLPSFLTSSAVVLGLLLSFSPLSAIKYISAIILFSLAASKYDLSSSPLHRGAVMGFSTLICGIAVKLFSGFCAADAAFLLLEAAVLIFLVPVFSKARTMLFSPHGQNADSVLAFSVFLCAAAAGLEGMFLTRTAFFLIALAAADKNSAPLSAAVGCSAGAVLGFSCGEPLFAVSSMAFASLLSGCFSRFGKFAAIASFALGFLSVTFASLPPSEIFAYCGSLVAAAALFLILPQSIFRVFSPSSVPGADSASLCRLAQADLEENAAAINEVAETFDKISEKTSSALPSADFFEKATDRLCRSCTKRASCWDEKFHRTSAAFFVLTQLCISKGAVKEEDIPEEIFEKCPETDKIPSVFNAVYDVCKVDRLWLNRVSESRKMVSGQLFCISERLLKSAELLSCGAKFDSSLSSQISAALTVHMLAPKSVCAVNGSRVDIETSHRGKSAISTAADIVSSCAGKPYIYLYTSGDTLHMVRAPRLKISASSSRRVPEKGNVCGDSTDFLYLKDGRFFMMISDGMGRGKKAGTDSHAALDITKKLLLSGFDTESTISMVNSVLVLKSSETAFATLDMVFIDPVRAYADFYKSGAAPSFVKRGKKVFEISSETLPAGVFDKTDVSKNSFRLSGGDIIFLASDGVITDRNREKIKDFIAKNNFSTPESAANELLSFAVSSDGVHDDMTVLAAFVTE